MNIFGKQFEGGMAWRQYPQLIRLIRDGERDADESETEKRSK